MSTRAATAPAKMSDSKFREHALGILERELGPEGLARFLRVYRRGTGNYTRDRSKWIGQPTVREIAGAISRRGKRSA